MKQGMIGVVVVLMIGSAWEMGRSEGSGGASSFSRPSNPFGGSSALKKLKKLSKKTTAKLAKEEAEDEGAKKAPDSFGVKAAVKEDEAASAKADAPAADLKMDGEAMGDSLKPVTADDIKGLMAAAKAGPAMAGAAAPAAMGEAAPGKAAAAPAMAAGEKPSRRAGRIGPKMKEGDLIIWAGSFPKGSVERTLKRRRRGFLSCYERALRGNPSLKGKIEFRIIVTRSGRVRSAEVESTTLKDGGTQKCIIRRIKSVRFPKPKGQLMMGRAVVTYPLIFSTE